jgi:hypothetical protein
MIIMRYIPKVGRGGLSGLGDPEEPIGPGQNPDDLMMMMFSLRYLHMYHKLIKKYA